MNRIKLWTNLMWSVLSFQRPIDCYWRLRKGRPEHPLRRLQWEIAHWRNSRKNKQMPEPSTLAWCLMTWRNRKYR